MTKKKRRQQPFKPFKCEDCTNEIGKHRECKGCWMNTESNLEGCFSCGR